jgi:hypothetical protein
MDMLRNRAHDAEQRAAASADAATFRAEALSLRDQLVHTQVKGGGGNARGRVALDISLENTKVNPPSAPTCR